MKNAILSVLLVLGSLASGFACADYTLGNCTQKPDGRIICGDKK